MARAFGPDRLTRSAVCAPGNNGDENTASLRVVSGSSRAHVRNLNHGPPFPSARARVDTLHVG